MQQRDHSTFYITLDSLLDTRFGVLTQILTPTQLSEVVINGYFTRECDVFYGVDPKKYEEAYQNRDKQTLKYSLISDIYRKLLYFINSTLIARVSTPYITRPVVLLNTYPYRLTESEQMTLIAALAGLVEKKADVSVTYHDYLTVSPETAKNEYVGLFMYDYWRWLEYHAENKNFEKTQCPEVYLIGPRLYQSLDAKNALKKVDAFQAIEEFTSPFVRTTLIDASEFSVTLARLKQLKAVMTV